MIIVVNNMNRVPEKDIGLEIQIKSLREIEVRTRGREEEEEEDEGEGIRLVLRRR